MLLLYQDNEERIVAYAEYEMVTPDILIVQNTWVHRNWRFTDMLKTMLRDAKLKHPQLTYITWIDDRTKKLKHKEIRRFKI